MDIRRCFGLCTAAIVLLFGAIEQPQQVAATPVNARSIREPLRDYSTGLIRSNSGPAYVGTVGALSGFFPTITSVVDDPLKRTLFIAYNSPTGQTSIARVSLQGVSTTLAIVGGIVYQIAYDAHTDRVYAGVGCSIVAIAPITGAQTLVAGGTCGTADGKGPAAQFQHPAGIAVDPTGSTLYVADSDRVRGVSVPGGNVSTLTAPGSIGGGGCYDQGFQGITFDQADGNLYIADSCPNIIRRVAIATGAVTTAAGQCLPGQFGGCAQLQRDGAAARALFAAPSGIAYDARDQNLYIADALNHQVRRLSAHGLVTTLAGSGHAEFTNGIGPYASFDEPDGIAVDQNGLLYVADTLNAAIRTIVSHGPQAPPPPHRITLMDVVDPGAQPYGLTFAPDGSLWYSEVALGKIVRIDVSGAKHVVTLPSGDYPVDLVADAAGNIWFSATGGFPPYFNGATLGVIHTDGTQQFYLISTSAQITSLALGPDGRVWFVLPVPGVLGAIAEDGTITETIADSLGFVAPGFSNDLWATGGGYPGNQLYVERFSTSGVLLKKYVVQNYLVQYMGPIAQGPQGRMWFTEPQAVGEVLPQTLATFQLPNAPPPSQNGWWGPQGVAEGPDGAVWFTANSVGDLGRMAAHGDFTAYEVPAPRSAPVRVVKAPDGSLWFTDYGACKIGRWF